MSRPRSRSPNYRRFPSEQRDLYPDRMPSDRNPHDHFPDEPRFGHQRHPDQGRLPHRKSPPLPDETYYHDRDGGHEVDGHRGESREHFPRFKIGQRSPTWSPREDFPFSGHHQRKPGMDWRREDQGRGRGGFRDSSPGMRPDDRREGYRGRWTGEGPNRGRFRDELHHDRGSPLKRPRREMDEHPGYRDENTGDAARGGFGGGNRGSFPHRRSNPGDVAHSREPSERDRFEDRGPHEPHFDRQRSPRSQEQFRGPHSKGEERGHAQDRRFDDPDYHDARQEAAFQGGPDNVRYDNRERPFHHRGWGGQRRMHNQRGAGRNDYHRNQPHFQHSHRDSAPQERPAHHHFRNEVSGPPGEEAEQQPGWAERGRRQQWETDAPRSLEDRDPKMPRQRMERGWSERKDDGMAVQTEETLTIKVDMSRPISHKSPLCYSSDRQLSLDLVNVGRQRLDFLPMLQHSGVYQESSTHTGTFAQEIITLVHLVKEQYFSGDGLTLNQRFSSPQTSDLLERTEELTLHQRFSSNRGFSSNLDSILDEDEPTQGLSNAPLRGPGDLRHDLERRRQEKLEGVKVTILGNSISQHSTGGDSEPDDMPQTEWAGQHGRRREGNMGPRRGASNRWNAGPPRRNFRFPYPRHSGPAGPHW